MAKQAKVKVKESNESFLETFYLLFIFQPERTIYDAARAILFPTCLLVRVGEGSEGGEIGQHALHLKSD